MRSIERCVAVWAGGRCGLAVCAAIAVSASFAGAQQPSTSRDELIRKWDLDRDGKITDGEAEVARSRMRRARLNAELGVGTDPLTGRPRTAGDASGGAAAGRLELGSSPTIRPELGSGPVTRPEEDGGLILVPGTGERGGRPLGLAAEPEPPPRREREALPGNRAPGLVPPAPQAAARGAVPAGMSPPRSTSALPLGRDERPPGAGRELTSRARVLPGGPPQPTADGARQQSVPGRPGVIAGGAAPGTSRTNMPTVRPGYGTGGPNELNAGRLPAGLPSARGSASGPAAASRMAPENQATTGRRPLAGVPGMRPTTASPPLPAPPRPGGAPPVPRATVAPRAPVTPRAPRPAAENVYGR